VLKKHIEKTKIQFPEYFSFTKASSPKMKDSLPYWSTLKKDSFVMEVVGAAE
jgi:hypothetical protein